MNLQTVSIHVAWFFSCIITSSFASSAFISSSHENHTPTFMQRHPCHFKTVLSAAASPSQQIDDRDQGKKDLSILFSRTAEIASVAFDLAVPLLSCAVSGGYFQPDFTKEISMAPVRLRAKSSTGTQQQQKQETISMEATSGDSQKWEKFWSTTTTAQYNNHQQLSNAERLVAAIERLGPTYVKFGQALASRPDIIPKSLAESLCTLQDDMEVFNTTTAKEIIERELKAANVDEVRIAILLDSLSPDPVAAASVGQVYKGYLLDVGEVAIKVQRSGIRGMVEKDAVLLKSLASFVESIPSPTLNGKLVNTQVRAAVDEFMSRIFEELDYTNEAANAKKFASLYSNKYGTARKQLPGKGVVVPEIITDYCTENVLVMEWISGKKLTSLETHADHDVTSNRHPTASRRNNNNDYLINKEKKENLALVEQALYITLSQLLEHGCMHADPHGGNLLKVQQETTSHGNDKRKKSTLAYLDFGLLATIPEQVRDGLVCAVSQLVFAKDVEAVASLFGELDLMPQEILNDPSERAALTMALTKTLEEVLIYPQQDPFELALNPNKPTTQIPKLKFDKLLDGLVRLVPRFQFQLPPYFINNARALGTLEGIARSLDPNFNAFSLMYPYALNRILQNPTGSPVVEATLQKMVRCQETGKIDGGKVKRLLRDSALLTGFSKRKVLGDILKTQSGREIAKELIKQESLGRLRPIKAFYSNRMEELCSLCRL